MNRPHTCSSNSFQSCLLHSSPLVPFTHWWLFLQVDGPLWPSPCSAGKPSPQFSFRFSQPSSLSAVSPQTDILLLVCASIISCSYHNFSLDPVPYLNSHCNVTFYTFCSANLLQLLFPIFIAGVTTSGDAFAVWMLPRG